MAIETLGRVSAGSVNFIIDIWTRITLRILEPQETIVLFQRLSVSNLRFNAKTSSILW